MHLLVEDQRPSKIKVRSVWDVRGSGDFQGHLSLGVGVLSLDIQEFDDTVACKSRLSYKSQYNRIVNTVQ